MLNECIPRPSSRSNAGNFRPAQISATEAQRSQRGDAAGSCSYLVVLRVSVVIPSLTRLHRSGAWRRFLRRPSESRVPMAITHEDVSESFRRIVLSGRLDGRGTEEIA